MVEEAERLCAECGQPLIENPAGDYAWFVVSGVGLVCSGACANKASRLPKNFWTLRLDDVAVSQEESEDPTTTFVAEGHIEISSGFEPGGYGSP